MGACFSFLGDKQPTAEGKISLQKNSPQEDEDIPLPANRASNPWVTNPNCGSNASPQPLTQPSGSAVAPPTIAQPSSSAPPPPPPGHTAPNPFGSMIEIDVTGGKASGNGCSLPPVTTTYRPDQKLPASSMQKEPPPPCPSGDCPPAGASPDIMSIDLRRGGANPFGSRDSMPGPPPTATGPPPTATGDVGQVMAPALHSIAPGPPQESRVVAPSLVSTAQAPNLMSTVQGPCLMSTATVGAPGTKTTTFDLTDMMDLSPKDDKRAPAVTSLTLFDLTDMMDLSPKDDKRAPAVTSLTFAL